jgi:subtilisin family serine protease
MDKEPLMKWISLAILACALFNQTPAEAATIAVIDSGLDYKHEFIVPNLWTNPNEVYDRRDNDGNGYQDDVNGWNFAEQNGQVIDYSYLGTFSPDCTKYFDVQGKYFLKQATEEEIAWMKAKIADPKFIKEMGKFGNFVHGTHVAGITIKGTQNRVMGMKLIPTEVKPFMDRLRGMKSANVDRWELMAKFFDMLGQTQMTQLGEIAALAAFHHADVANGSFGMGFHQAKLISDNAFKILFFRKPTAEESDKGAGMLVKAMVNQGKTFVGRAPNTLFVFAAGNDGMNNDTFGTSPANIKEDNVITVGATYKNEFFAPFSNYGTKMVDVAAPGMLIRSSVPGNEYLAVSGTSQASPYVANVAGQVKAANPALKPVEIRKILMGTVDMKAFLTEKVAAGGIVNPDRARTAAELTKSMNIEEAISRSRTMVRDMVVNRSEVDKSVVIPMDMTSTFR